MIKVNTMGTSRKGRNKAISGFTLAEILIALGILLILMAVGVIAGTRIIRNTRQSHLDKRAEAVYYAAQSRMMELFVTQEKVEEEITKDGKTVTVSVVDELYNGNKFDYNGKELGYVTSDDSGSIVFKDNTLSSEVGGSNVIIEYDPISLDVYAVILSDTPDKGGTSLAGLTGQGSGAPVRGTAQDRIDAYKGYVGYYAEGDNGALGAKSDSGLSAGAWIVNGRDLLGIVKITVDKETKDLLTNLTYKLTVRGPKTGTGENETYTELNITGRDIVWQNYQGGPDNNYLNMTGAGVGSGQRHTVNDGSLQANWFGDVSNSADTYGLIGYIKLDSLDKDYRLSDLLAAGIPVEGHGGEIKPGQDISISIKVWDSDSADGLSQQTRSATAVSNIENSLFGDFDYKNNLSVAEIIYPRHLQNLDYEYAKAEAANADGAPANGAKIAAVLAEDIDWSEEANKYNSNVRNFTPISNPQLVSFTGERVELQPSTTQPIIDQLAAVAIAAPENVTAVNPEYGNGADTPSANKFHVIENIRIDTTDTNYEIVGTDKNAGLFGNQAGITIANLVLRKFDIKHTEGTEPIGMLASKLTDTSTVKNIYVYNKPDDAITNGLNGSGNIGGVIGEADTLTLDGVVVKNLCVNSTSGAAGALLGKGTSTNNIKNALAYNGMTPSTGIADPDSNTDPNAGAGTGTGNEGGTATTGEDSLGTTADIDDSGYEIVGAQAAGGLIGENAGGTIEGCGAALYVRSTAGNAGGLVGTLGGGSVKNSYSGGHTITVDGRAGIYSDETSGEGRINVLGTNAGGLIGSSAGSIDASYSTCSAAGSSATGGIAGSASGSINNSYAVGRVLMGSNPGALVGASSANLTNNYYISLINESYDTTADEFVYLYGIGGATEEVTGAVAVDVDEENDGAEGIAKYNQFMVDASGFPSEDNAGPYDMTYKTYGMKTTDDLASTSDCFFAKSHYGDWPVPEHIIYNDSSGSARNRDRRNFFVINAMAMSEDTGGNTETVTTSETAASEEASSSSQEEVVQEPQETQETQEAQESAEQASEETTQPQTEDTSSNAEEGESAQSNESDAANSGETTQEDASENESAGSQEGESAENKNEEAVVPEKETASTENADDSSKEATSDSSDSSSESSTSDATTQDDTTTETVEEKTTSDDIPEKEKEADLEEAADKKEKDSKDSEKKEKEATEELIAAGELYSPEEMVKLIYGEDAEIPEGAEVQVVELTPDDEKYEEYVSGATNALEIEGDTVASVKVLDIKIIKDGEEIQPKAAVNVELNTEQLYENKEVYSDDEILTVHFNEENNEAEVIETEVKVNEEETESEVSEETEENTALTEAADTVSFVTDGFSVYVFVQPVKEKVVTASDGNVYDISVTYDNASGIPAGAELVVDEIEKGSEGYDNYVEEGKACLGIEGRLITYARAFDISFVNPETGDRYQPSKDVNVSIKLLQDDMSENEEDSMISVAHFGEEAEAVGIAVEDGAIKFNTTGFSVYLVTRTVKERIVECSDGSTYKVTVTYDGSAGIPGDAELLVTEIGEGSDNYDNYVQISANLQEKEVESFIFARPFDIKLVNSETGEEYQPREGVQVSMELLGTELRDDADLCVVHIPDDENNANIVDFEVNDGAIDFRTDGFSIFVYTESTFLRTYRFFNYVSKTDRRYVEYSIFTDAGNTTFTQKIKNNGEEVIVPRLPSLEGSDTSTFAGWYLGTDVTSTTIEGITYFTPATLADDEFDFDVIPEVTQTETIYLFAKFADYAYVIFHDQYNGSSQSFPVAQTRRGEKINGTAEIEIGDVSVAYDDGSTSAENTAPSYAFYGWSYTPITTPGSTVDDAGNPVSRIPTDSISISEKTDLYPIFQSIFWLTFSAGPTGSGATYVPAKYYYSGEGPSSLTVPVRSGYNFEGWYADATVNDQGIVTAGTRISDGNGVLINGATASTASVSGGKLMLSGNTKLTANWSEAPVQYSIVIWRQKATDDINLLPAAKSYDYAETIGLDAGTGTTVSVPAQYRSYSTGDYEGFTCGRYDPATTVASDGSTVLNVYYDRNVHTLTFKVGGNTVKTITALFGASIKDNFPIVSQGGTSYNGYRWSDQSGRVYTYVLASIDTMPNADVTFVNSGTPGTRNTLYYYVEIGDPSESTGTTRTFNGKLYTLYKTVNHNFNYLTYNEEYHPISGYTRSYTNAQPAFNPSTNRADIGTNRINYIYYDRDQFSIDFYDSYTSEHAYINGDFEDTVSIKYNEVIKNYLPDDPSPIQIAGGTIASRDGYSFTGWYTDKECTTRAFFDENDPDYQKAKQEGKNPTLFDRMPAYNLRFYAGWDAIWYLIQIDPNNGQLSASEATWFWEPYNGDLVQEYSDVTRDYVESTSGTYYYVNKNRAYYGYPDEYVPNESDDRRAYYTDSLDDVKDFTRYKYAQNAYRYAGWYEVDDNGNETLYNFNSPVTHNLKLVLHWKKIGTYFVQYNPVVEKDGRTLTGTIDNGDSNEQVFAELDGDDYSDNANVVVTRTAHAPEGYNFVGWRIRGDDSGNIYRPGQSFIMKAKYTVTVGGNEMIYLDAVYTRIGTAKIIYDANYGEINESIVDYGMPTEFDAPTPSRVVDSAAKTATIAQLVNNSPIRLSSGRGFEFGTAELTGWNTAPDRSGEHYELGGEYYVDTEEPITLYAEWKIKAYFDKNWPEAGWGGDWNDTDEQGNPIFAYDDESGRYYTYVYVNNTVREPQCIPESPDPEKMFYYWSRERYTEHPAQYNFSTPVTESNFILHAHWGNVKTIPAHAVDTSAETFVKKDDEWLVNGRLTVVDVNNDDVFLDTATDVAPYVPNVTGDYEFAFTCVSDSTQNCSEVNAISKVWYNIDTASIYVTYKNGSSGELNSDDEIYFVYFKNPKNIDIGYVWMDTNRSISPVQVNQNAPLTATLGEYSVDGNITAPLSYQTTTEYGYYAYAIGGTNVSNDSELKLITKTSNSNSNRPVLTTKNSWNGFRYTIDGTEWTNVGYDAKLYVVYFNSMPSVLTLKERTFGTQNDMEEEFTYTVKIVEKTTVTVQQIKRTRWASFWSWGDWTNDGPPVTTTPEGEPSIETLVLKDDEKETISLFYVPTIVQRIENSVSSSATTQTGEIRSTTVSQVITITQTKKDDFTVNNDATGDNKVNERTYTYTTSEENLFDSPSVLFTNIRKKRKVEIHVAVIDADDNGDTTIIQRDEMMRTDGEETTQNNSFEIEINYPTGDHTKFFNAEGIFEELPPIATDSTAGVLKTGFEGYGFAGVAYGEEDGNGKVEIQWPRSNLDGISTIEKITYGKLFEDRENIYDLYFNGDRTYKVGRDFQDTDEMPVSRLYYLYYRVPRVVYVKESEGGVLTRVKGSLDGTNVVDNITYNGNEQTIASGLNLESNEGKVVQEQLLPVSTELFTISQSSTDFFNMLPLMDDDTNKLYLTYSMIGIGKSADITKITDLSDYVEVGTGPSYAPLYLQSVDNQLKWSKDNVTWNNFAGEVPTIYAIYKEKGFHLNLAKVLKNGSTTGKDFKLRISSLAIMESSYEVEGTGAVIITATPISVDNEGQTKPGTIDITVKSIGDIGTEGTNGNTVRKEDIQNSAVVIKGLAKGKYTISEILTEGSGSYELNAEAADNWEDIWDVYGTENDSDEVTRIKKEDVVITTKPEGRFLTLPELDFTELTIVGTGENAVASKMVLLANTSDKTRRIILRKENTGTNKPVSGATFDIYYSDGSLFEENCVAGSAGAYYVGDMPYGTFYIHEKSPSVGYYQLKIYDKDDGSEHGVVELSTEAKPSIEAWTN